MKNCIIASTSTIHGSGYLEYLLPELAILFKKVDTIVFIPYARPSGISYDEYTSITKKAFAKININVIGIHEFNDPKSALENANGIFVGGGNTFVLVNELYKQHLFDVLKEQIEEGTPYLGTSAGSNICGPSMQTTNDMPIVMPSSFKTMAIIPFNINAHYLDPDSLSKHKGETRETRIKEFHHFNETVVLGLREGSWLQVLGDEIILKGDEPARLFIKNTTPKEIEPLTKLNYLIN